MGKLLALELYNFKSYKGHHVLRFGDSYFTSIIGPNGSGKSNSMDAISFVLGIKSSHLRSTHLKDLVYRGRVLKHSKINADGTATEDTLNGIVEGDLEADAIIEEPETQSSQRGDPQSAWVMAVYEDDAGDEQRWKRTITASGQSEYRINNRAVTAKAYNDALEAENILIKARNFLVFQGDVEAIASQSPKDLTRLIEQISGSLDYKVDYEKLKAEKEKADEDQAYKLTQRRGINGEIKQYQQQKEELDKYEQTRDEKDQAVVTHVLWKLFHFQRAIEDSTAQIQKHQAELKEFRRHVQKYEDRLTTAKAEQAKVGRDVNKHERDIKRREKEVEERENTLIPIDEKLSIHAKQLTKHDSVIQTISAQSDEQQKQADKMKKDLATVQAAQQRWQKEWQTQQQQTGRQLSNQDLQDLERLRKDVYQKTGNAQSKIENITRQIKTDEETVRSLKSKVESTQSIVSNLEEQVGSLEARRTEVAQTVKSISKESDSKQKAINALISDRERTDQKRRELEEKLHKVLVTLSEAQGFQHESQKEARQRELVAQLKRIFPGVKGAMSTLCKPKQKKYELAVSTVLGRHFDSVIVDTEKTGRECIDYLKEQRIGILTFVPLDTVIHQQPNAKLRGMQQGVRLAIDTIDFDSSLERAISYACDNAVVTDTLNIARSLCYEKGIDVKAVTLDGTIIHKGGNMTGGEGLHEKKRRFEDTEVDNLRTMANKFKGDLEEIPRGHKRQAEEEQLQSELTGLKARLSYAQDELRALDNNLASKRAELKHAKSVLHDIQPKHNDQSAGLDNLRASLETFSSEVAQVEDQVFGAFCQRVGYSSIREYERQQGVIQEEAKQKEHDFKRQIGRLTNQLQFEEQRLRDSKLRLKTSQDASKRDRQLVADLEAEKEQISQSLDELNEAIDETKERLQTLKKSFEERGVVVEEARRELQKRSKNVEKVLKDVSTLEAEVHKASSSRYGLLRNCKVEDINLPLERGSRKVDALPLEEAILDADADADEMDVDGEDVSIRMPQVDDYGIRVDFQTLEDDLKEDESDECEATLIENISKLQSALQKMAPNMRSAERLEATSERLKATDQEFNDSRSMARTANKRFEDVRKKRMDLFNKAFSHISEQIGPVYRELTKTQSFPLGGSASLDVEDEDEPYLSGVKYHAMPPLKRFRDMEHLSGGEKTMAALALLFAVHTYAPSPFFVLDEVDAALDHANTTQLAQYVREHAGPGMQFVVISLKTGLFQNSETLVGVMRDQAVNSSRALTLDLRKYQAV